MRPRFIVLGAVGWGLAGCAIVAYVSMRSVARRLVRYAQAESMHASVVQAELVRADAAELNNRRVYRALLEYYGRMYPPGLDALQKDGAWITRADITPEMAAEMDTAQALEDLLVEAQEAERKRPPSEDNILRLR